MAFYKVISTHISAYLFSFSSLREVLQKERRFVLFQMSCGLSTSQLAVFAGCAICKDDLDVVGECTCYQGAEWDIIFIIQESQTTTASGFDLVRRRSCVVLYVRKGEEQTVL